MDQIEDYNDVTWHEQQMLERQMLDNDPGYIEFLNKVTQEKSHGDNR